MAPDKGKTTMTERFATYDKFFSEAFAGQQPFDYQRRLALDDPIPSLVNAPTGAGKTNTILGAWMWRRLKKPDGVGRRLIYCLPMRTLVEQTRDVARAAIKRLGFEDRSQVHVLMGGDLTGEWDSWPERECILIGTQDMLLSRALNRGYAMSRFRWPLHFGLLNNDCLWVFDEVQLMGDGLATAAQLAAFRERYKTYGVCHSLWLAHQLDQEWLKTVDFAPCIDALTALELSEADRTAPSLVRRLKAVKKIAPAPGRCRTPEGLAEFVKASHTPGM